MDEKQINPDAGKPSRREDAVEWLQAAHDRLDLDSDLIAVMPLEDVLEELHQAGIDEKPLVASVRARVAAATQRRNGLRLLRRSLPLQMAAVIALLLATSILLWRVDRLSRSPYDALATLAPYEDRLEAVVQRASVPVKAPGAVAQVQAHLADAILHLQEAYTTTLGLFPRYDHAEVERALMSLENASRALKETTLPVPGPQKADSTVQLQQDLVALLTAKAHLMQQDVPEARRWLALLAKDEGSPFQTDARTLLQRLEEMPAPPEE